MTDAYQQLAEDYRRQFKDAQAEIATLKKRLWLAHVAADQIFALSDDDSEIEDLAENCMVYTDLKIPFK